MSENSSSRTKSQKPKTPVDRAGDLARQIWLAGVGAYGQAVDDTQEKVTQRVARVSEETTKLFDELVSRGNDLEQRLGELGSIGKLGAEAGAEKLRRGADMSLSLEDRLARMRDMLGLAPVNRSADEKFEELRTDLAALHKKVDALIAAQDGAPKRKVTAKKATKKRTSAKKKSPAPKKKAVAKKKKVPAKKTVKRT